MTRTRRSARPGSWTLLSAPMLLFVAACTIWNGVSMPADMGSGVREAGSYEREVRASGPIAHWRFDEIETDAGLRVVRDVSGHGHDCTASSGATIERGPFPDAPAIHLGDGDALSCPGDDAFAFPSLSPFTFEAFVLHDADGAGNQNELRHIFDRMGGSSPRDRLGYYAYLFRAANTDEWSLNLERWRGNAEQEGVRAASRGELAAGTWAHFAITQAGDGRLVVYLNGTPRADALAVAAPAPAGVRLILGQNQSRSCCSLIGKIAEMTVYDRALDAETVARHYRAGTPVPP